MKFVSSAQGGPKTPEIFVLNHPTTNDVTSGQKIGAAPVSAKLKSYQKWSIGRVWFFRICEQKLSWYFTVRISASCRDIVSTSWSQILPREKRLVSFCRGKTESEVPYHGGYFTPWKRVVFQLLPLVVPDASITSCSIAYHLYDIMDEILVVIVCSQSPLTSLSMISHWFFLLELPWADR